MARPTANPFSDADAADPVAGGHLALHPGLNNQLAASWNYTEEIGRLANLNTQTGTTYTLVLTDAGKVVRCTNASAVTVTIPPSSTTAFEIGTVIEIRQAGAGQVTVSPGAGVTLNSESSMRKTAAQYRSVSLHKVATDTWDLDGSLVL